MVAALLAFAAIAEHNATVILRSLAGMIFSLVFYLIIALAAPGALGAADLRLAGLLGLALPSRSFYGAPPAAPHSLRPSLDQRSLHRPTGRYRVIRAVYPICGRDIERGATKYLPWLSVIVAAFQCRFFGESAQHRLLR